VLRITDQEEIEIDSIEVPQVFGFSSDSQQHRDTSMGSRLASCNSTSPWLLWVSYSTWIHKVASLPLLFSSGTAQTASTCHGNCHIREYERQPYKNHTLDKPQNLSGRNM